MPQDTQPYVEQCGWLQSIQVVAVRLRSQDQGLFLATLRLPMQTEAQCSRYRLPAQPQRMRSTLHYLKALQRCWSLRRCGDDNRNWCALSVPNQRRHSH